MFGIKQCKKKSKPTLALCLGFMCVSALTPVNTVFADPTNSNNSNNSSSERLLSKKNCYQIMNDTNYLQRTLHFGNYANAVKVGRDENTRKGKFATDARMLPLFNEVAKDPYSRAVHRKIYRLCGATNFNGHIAKEKRDAIDLHVPYANTDWGM